MKIKSLALLIIITILLGIFYFIIRDNDSTIKTANSDFSFNAKSNFNNIEISDHENITKLVYRNNKWYIGEEEEANQRKVNNAIRILQNLEMQYPLSVSETGKIVDSLKQYGNLITIYNNNKTIYKLRYFSFNNKNIALDKHNLPFAISVKGESELLLSEVLNNNPQIWSKTLVCDIPYQEIVRVKLEFPREYLGFIIDKNTDTTKIKGLYGFELENISSEQVNDYLHFFRGITYTTPVEQNDALVNWRIPFFVLELSNKNKQTINIEGYQQIYTRNKTLNPYYFTGIVNKTDTLVFSYSAFDPILVNPEYFSKK